MLYGKRVMLRPMRREDLPRYWAFNNDVETELLGGGDPPIPQGFERLEAQFHQDAGQGGRDGLRFAVEADGLFIGHCALFNFNNVAFTSELGITIGDPDYRGKGYGREVLHLLLDYAFRLRNIRKVYLNVHADNARALKAYQSVGFVEEARWRRHVWSNGGYVDLIGMGVFADEWKVTYAAYQAQER